MSRVTSALIWLALSLGFGCPATTPESPPPPARTVKEASRVRHRLPAGVSLRSEQNGLIMPRSWSFITERPDHPGLAALRQREKLDAVVAPGADEWSKMRLLCSWANSQFAMGTPDPYPPWDANAVLEMIRSGRTGGYCAQYAVVFVQACAAMGWPARYLDIKPRDPKDGNGHITVEIWSNHFNRWVALDPTMDATFELDGRPLSALEIHQALVGGRDEQVKLVHGGGKHGRANVGPSEAQVVKFFFHLAADLRAESQRAIESSPEWRERVERTLELLEGCDSLAALEALVNALRIYRDPVQRRYFPVVWKHVHERMQSQSR